MAVPFRDRRTEDYDLGLAGYLRFIDEPDAKGVRGCLFCVNARGEPIDFSFTRIDVAAPLLWRPGEARRRAVTDLAKALFAASSKAPRLLLTLAGEAPAGVFVEDLEVHLPLCRVAGAAASRHAASASLATLSDDARLCWVGKPPPPDSPAHRLLVALNGRRLATEPFDRAASGLNEVFGPS